MSQFWPTSDGEDTESKAFEKSKIATSVRDPESRALAQSSIASIN